MSHPLFASALIVLRETIEAALFIGIVAAATRGLAGRSRWLTGGVVVGLLGALALAAGAEQVGSWAEGIGQDLVNVAILSVALAMLAWHCIWMSPHGREMALKWKKRALEVEIEAISAGYLPKDALDTLDAARYLRDSEEYWPFEGDDWPDEFVGSEGLK